MSEGMNITLSALPGGITVDLKGRKLLAQDFVFQCGPMEEFKVTHAFSSPNYDTIMDGQFTRSGGRQLKVWQFDTLAMEIGVHSSDPSRSAPGWVPFVKFDYGPPLAGGGINRVPVPPEWYLQQIVTIADAGCPFRFTAHMPGKPGGTFHQTSASFEPVLSVPAVLLSFDEGRKAGEGDAIYLTGVSFQEWRDPRVSQRGLGSTKPKAKKHGSPSDTPPTSVKLYPNGVCVTHLGKEIPIPPEKNTITTGPTSVVPSFGPRDCTLADLARHFYHNPADWRVIAKANGLTQGGANMPLLDFPKFKNLKSPAVIQIPALASESLSQVFTTSEKS